MGIIVVLYTAKIKLKTLESQGLAYHKYSIHGHYNYNFNFHTLLQCCITHSPAHTGEPNQNSLLLAVQSHMSGNGLLHDSPSSPSPFNRACPGPEYNLPT